MAKGESATWRRVVETEHRVLVNDANAEIMAMVQSRGNKFVWTVYDEEGNAVASGFSPYPATAEKECVGAVRAWHEMQGLSVRDF